MDGLHRPRSKVLSLTYSSSNSANLLSKYEFFWLQKPKMMTSCKPNASFPKGLHKAVGGVREGCHSSSQFRQPRSFSCNWHSDSCCLSSFYSYFISDPKGSVFVWTLKSSFILFQSRTPALVFEHVNNTDFKVWPEPFLLFCFDEHGGCRWPFSWGVTPGCSNSVLTHCQPWTKTLCLRSIATVPDADRFWHPLLHVRDPQGESFPDLVFIP